MLVDHSGILLFPKLYFLRIIGRLAFPIFAFLATEGYFHTRNLKKYLLRLLCFAIISEIPYNILKTGTIYDYSRRNVLWTLLFGILLIHAIEYIRNKYDSIFLHILTIISACAISFIFGIIVRADYGYAGIMTMLVFYLFKERKMQNLFCQAILLFAINTFILNSSCVFIGNIGIPKQLFAVFSLIPIWLYKGKQGYKSKTLSFIYYSFYPLHIILLVIIHIAIH